MTRKLTAILAALALAMTALMPGVASARDHRGGWDGDRGGGYYNDRGRHYRGHRDNDGDELAAGAIGLVLGLALGAAASQPRTPRYGYNNNCYNCGPPPPPRGYYNQGYYNQGYAPPPPPRYYDDRQLDGGYYDDGYDRRSQCTRRERQYDRYARQYVMVDVPC